MALANDGTVWTWGLNSGGQLGDSTTTISRVPVQTRSLTHYLGDYCGTGQHARAAHRREHLELGRCQPRGAWAERRAVDAERRARAVSGPAMAAGAGRGRWARDHALRAARWECVGRRVELSGSARQRDGGHRGTKSLAAASGLALADNSWLLTDGDGDGVPTWRELLTGLDPLRADSDGDGLSDGVELNASQPGAHPDADGDGVPNTVEVARGTDPFNADTDGDTVNDRLDAFPLDPTRSTAPSPTPGDTTPPVITLIEPTNAIPIPP